MRGRAVKLLQRRLAALKYYPGRVNGRFGQNTLEAVWAFQETQGLHPRNAVNAEMQQALASPRAPKVLVRHGGRTRIAGGLRGEQWLTARAWSRPRASTVRDSPWQGPAMQ